MAIELKDIQQRKSEEVYVEGYFAEGCTLFNPGLNTTEWSEAVHGQEDPISGTDIENGTLSITLLERYSTPNLLMDLLCNYDPATASSIKRNYEPSLVKAINIWSNIKNQAGTQYISSKFMKNYSPPLSLITGEITGRGRREFTGNCDVILEFNAPIFAEKIAVQRIESPAEDVGDGVEKTPVSLEGAVADDGGVQTDETTAANDSTANDMTLLPATPALDDAYYFGCSTPKDFLRINIGTAGEGTWTITWEYWNGAWTALSGVTDGTSGFTAAAGNHDVTYTFPTDWAETAVNGITSYWIRARVSAYTSVTTQPLGTQAWWVDYESTFDMKYNLVNPDTLVVKVAGVTKTAGTHYNHSPRTGAGGVDQIIFTSGNHPLTGEAITAEYIRYTRLSNRCYEIPPDTDLYALAVIALNQESPVWDWVGQGDTSTTTFTLAHTDVDSSSLKVYLDGTLTTAYTFSDGTGAGGKDQIIFSSAPGEKVAITATYTRDTEGNTQEDLNILETMVNSNQATMSSVNNTTTFDCDIPNADRYKFAVGDEVVVWDVSAKTWLYQTGTTGVTIASISDADGGDQGTGYTKITATTNQTFGTGTPADGDVLYLYDDSIDQIEDGLVNPKAVQDQTDMGSNMTHVYVIYLGYKSDISVYPEKKPDGIRGEI